MLKMALNTLSLTQWITQWNLACHCIFLYCMYSMNWEKLSFIINISLYFKAQLYYNTTALYLKLTSIVLIRVFFISSELFLKSHSFLFTFIDRLYWNEMNYGEDKDFKVKKILITNEYHSLLVRDCIFDNE